MDRLPLLVSVDGPLEGLRYQVLDGDGITVGRADNCDVVIDDPEVSRHHATVVLYNSGIWIRDEGSRNGVFIDEKRVVRPKELRPGSELNIGGHHFTLELDEVAEDDPSIVRPVRSTAVEKKQQGNPLFWVVVFAAVLCAAFALMQLFGSHLG
jgi:pSer/pThr/pTyr-binding forkhead associated (FHA) protein